MDGFTFEKNRCVCFTGHRTLPAEEIGMLEEKLDRELASCIKNGKTVFLAGGAVGFDTLAAFRVIEARKENPEVKLILVLPCRDQTERWKSLRCLNDYKIIKDSADQIIYTKDFYDETCMRERNTFMVNHSSKCIAYLRNSSGGTANTVRYANSQSVEVINLA